ncbi:arrestin domain-containing protein 17 [Condylostylus longicornis]|uniref:arrestin domain-containing protein 17 n=1 Tax=Condylostylus longicornis TaxID=2530218 RepID=UPI00244E3AC8|nr:arrestin domain-containing protein 17 [Condylostylus longicornis]
MPRKLLKFLIIFDNTSLLYFPGQFLSGRVLLELQDDTPALGLHFHVVGEGVVRVGSSRQERTYDKENYIDFRMKLFGDIDQGPAVLSPGIHSFPFKLGLPVGLPSTFLGRYGWIQYYCKAALREPNGLIHKNHQVFIVMNPIDLNLEKPILSHPFSCEVEHKLGVACVGGGSVKCRVSLDKGGYVPGESISITAYVKNNSNVVIKRTKAALTETIEYLARGKCIQVEKRALAEIARGKIRSGEKDEWRNESLYVPPLPPTNLRGCHLIKIQYDVFFIVEPKSLEKEIKLQLPIVLATYPFRTDNHDVSNTWPDSVLKPDTHYPSTLPIFRPWLHEKPDP